jgi:hypothetical protein
MHLDIGSLVEGFASGVATSLGRWIGSKPPQWLMSRRARALQPHRKPSTRIGPDNRWSAHVLALGKPRLQVLLPDSQAVG